MPGSASQTASVPLQYAVHTYTRVGVGVIVQTGNVNESLQAHMVWRASCLLKQGLMSSTCCIWSSRIEIPFFMLCNA